MLYRLYATVEFDRKIDQSEHYICPGAYEARFNDGRTLRFDFECFEGSIDPDDPKILHWCNRCPDTDSFEDIPNFSYKDFKKHFTGFDEFFIFTGEANEPEIHPVKVHSVELEFDEVDENEERYLLYRVPKKKLPKAIDS